MFSCAQTRARRRVAHELVELVDVFATLAALARLPLPAHDAQPLDGRSFLPLLFPPAQRPGQGLGGGGNNSGSGADGGDETDVDGAVRLGREALSQFPRCANGIQCVRAYLCLCCVFCSSLGGGRFFFKCFPIRLFIISGLFRVSLGGTGIRRWSTDRSPTKTNRCGQRRAPWLSVSLPPVGDCGCGCGCTPLLAGPRSFLLLLYMLYQVWADFGLGQAPVAPDGPSGEPSVVSLPLWDLNDCNDVNRSAFTHMGLSLRTQVLAYALPRLPSKKK